MPESFHQLAAILFADIVGLTGLSSAIGAGDVVAFLNQVFSSFDRLADRLGLEKVKTIGDAYMAAAGLPLPRPDHAEGAAEMALAMMQEIGCHRLAGHGALSLRIGLNSGPVVAGVIGERKFSYDVWGDTVNVARRMESAGQAGAIQLTEATRVLLGPSFHIVERGRVKVKGKGEMTTYFLRGRE